MLTEWSIAVRRHGGPESLEKFDYLGKSGFDRAEGDRVGTVGNRPPYRGGELAAVEPRSLRRARCEAGSLRRAR